jgi:predicted transcriptional regulator
LDFVLLEIEDVKNKYRDRLEIISDVLLVVEEKRSRKTRIMYGANLSYKLLKHYLKETLNAKLLDYADENHYKITERGKKFLKLFQDYKKKSEDAKNGKKLLRKMASTDFREFGL